MMNGKFTRLEFHLRERVDRSSIQSHSDTLSPNYSMHIRERFVVGLQIQRLFGLRSERGLSHVSFFSHSWRDYPGSSSYLFVDICETLTPIHFSTYCMSERTDL